ncbi:CPBP family intramembrane glutamic endopeptidase [Dactylosporangium sp. CA-233914]|uniref:CPBP family intramembrane glutamic endopeptidase n=1 Tax=Dactylosporangium sp. CA-233914 TaxID=3239934 RepID=UPI003D8A95EB
MRRLVQRFPVATFFVLAFGVSWLAWVPYVLSQSGLGLVPLRIPSLLGSTQLVGLLPGAYLGPLTAAFVVTVLTEGREGLRRWSRRLIRWRVGWKWYALVLLAVPAGILLATCALPGAWGHIARPSAAIVVAYVPVLLMQIVTTAMAEEPGWRDFALPRLQSRFGALAGTVVLGVLWGCWHLPLFLTEWGGWPDVWWVSPIEFVACCVPLSLVMTWVFNRTGESLPVVMVLHAGINTTYSLIWSEVFPTLNPVRDTPHATLIGSTAVALILIAATRGRLGLKTRAAHEVRQLQEASR